MDGSNSQIDQLESRHMCDRAEEQRDSTETQTIQSMKVFLLENGNDAESIITFETYSTFGGVSRLSDHGTLGCDQSSIAPSIIHEHSVSSNVRILGYASTSNPLDCLVLEMAARFSETVSLVWSHRMAKGPRDSSLSLVEIERSLREASLYLQLASHNRSQVASKFSDEDDALTFQILAIFINFQKIILESIARGMQAEVDRIGYRLLFEIDELPALVTSFFDGVYGAYMSVEPLQEGERWDFSQKSRFSSPGDARQWRYEIPGFREREEPAKSPLRDFCPYALALRYTNTRFEHPELKRCPCCTMKVPKKYWSSLNNDKKIYAFSSRLFMKHHIDSGQSRGTIPSFGCSLCSKRKSIQTRYNAADFATHLELYHPDELDGLDGVRVREMLPTHDDS